MTQLGKQLVVHAGERRWKRSKLERALFYLFAVAAIVLVAGLLILLMQNRWETSKNTEEIAQQQETIQRLLSISQQKDAQKRSAEAIIGEDVYFDKYLPNYPYSPYVDHTRQQVADDSFQWFPPENWFEADENDGPATDVRKKSKTDLMEDFTELYSNDSNIIDPVVRICGMGMLSRAIEDSQISASTDYTQSFHGKYGRLDETCQDVYWLGNSYGCWLPLEKAMPQEDQWFQVDLKKPQPVGGIITQGRPKHYDQWVTSFQISCGITPDKLVKVEQVYSGNYDRNSKVMHFFPQPILCRYIRFHPVSWQGQVALRMELIKGNCISEKNPDSFWKMLDREDLPQDEDLSEIQNNEENTPTEIEDLSITPDDEYRSTNDTKIEEYVQECAMGMKSRAIKDRRISASHDYTNSFHGKFGRLDETCDDVYYLGNSYGCWLPYDKDIENQWLQVDLKRPQLIGGIVTQGRPKHYNQYVETFQISCGKNSDQLHKIEENGEPKVFNGNFDSTSKVMNIFSQPMLCRYVRFHPVTVQTTALRMELLRGNCGPDRVEIEIDHVSDLSKNLASEELLDSVTDQDLDDEVESAVQPFDDESFSGDYEASGAEDSLQSLIHHQYTHWVSQPHPEKAKTGGFVRHLLANLRRRMNGKGRNEKSDI